MLVKLNIFIDIVFENLAIVQIKLFNIHTIEIKTKKLIKVNNFFSPPAYNIVVGRVQDKELVSIAIPAQVAFQ